MKTTNSMTNLLKGISLIILDIITFLIVFSVWSIINIPLFPWALIAILFSLLAINTIIWGANGTIHSYGVPMYVSILFVTGLYYLLIMIYTGVVYAVVTPKGYIIMVLIYSLIYISVMTGLYFSAINHRADTNRQETEKNCTINVNLSLIEIENAIREAKAFIGKDQYDKLLNDFELMKERLLASTPIGRVTKPVIKDMDIKLNIILTEMQNDILTLRNSNDIQNIFDNILNKISSAKAIIINREKLIIQ